MLVKEVFFRLFFLEFFFSFYFLNAIQNDNNSNRLSLFFGMNIFWALLRAHFNHHLMAWIKMSLSQAQNIIIPVNINSIVLFDFRSLQIYFQAKNQHPTKVHYRLLSSVATRLCQILSWHRHYL